MTDAANRHATLSGVAAARIASNKLAGLPRYQQGRQRVVLTVLVALALAVFLLLPQFVSEPWVSVDKPAPEDSAGKPAVITPSSQAEKSKYRQEAQFLLAKVIAIRDRLQQQQVQRWAGFAFDEALQSIAEGDEQYGRAEYAQSLDSYQRGFDQLQGLTALAADKLAEALVDGVAAVENSQLQAATAAADLASALAEEESAVKQLQRRVKQLPKVIEQLQQGAALEAEDKLTAASEAYQQAVKLDPQHQQAASALTAVKQAITEQQFARLMSQGYRALDADQFEQANALFKQAATVDGDQPAVTRALAQVSSRQSQLWVSRQMSQARQFEQREQWQQAVEVYQRMLATEPSLTEAKARQLPASIRAQLDERLQQTLAEPMKLAYQGNFDNARNVLRDAKSIANPGARLSQQIQSLEQLLTQIQTPVTVEFLSDSQTEVTLFRVAKLGYFEQKTLSLKAGNYVVAGSRKGYRDVRVEFTINGKPLDKPIVVRCVEPI